MTASFPVNGALEGAISVDIPTRHKTACLQAPDTLGMTQIPATSLIHSSSNNHNLVHAYAGGLIIGVFFGLPPIQLTLWTIRIIWGCSLLLLFGQLGGAIARFLAKLCFPAMYEEFAQRTMHEIVRLGIALTKVCLRVAGLIAGVLTGGLFHVMRVIKEPGMEHSKSILPILCVDLMVLVVFRLLWVVFLVVQDRLEAEERSKYSEEYVDRDDVADSLAQYVLLL